MNQIFGFIMVITHLVLRVCRGSVTTKNERRYSSYEEIVGKLSQTQSHKINAHLVRGACLHAYIRVSSRNVGVAERYSPTGPFFSLQLVFHLFYYFLVSGLCDNNTR